MGKGREVRSWMLGTILVGLGATRAQARVFDMNKENFAAYLRVEYGIAGQKDSPYASSSGNGVSFDEEYKYNPAYEFGFIYSTSIVNWRFGLEILKPTAMKGITGKDSSNGTTLFTLNNDISGYVPKIGLEINLLQGPRSRFYLGGDYGFATVTVQNSYTFTAAGTTKFSLSDFREEVKGSGAQIKGAIGFETLLSDTTTLAVDAGYRQLKISSFSHNVATATFQGTVSSGSNATQMNGGNRDLNMSGIFASVNLRFWLK